MFGLGPFELAVIGIIAVILFGGNLPEVAKTAGGKYAEFRRSLNDIQRQFREATTEVKSTFDVSVDDDDRRPEDDAVEDLPAGPVAPRFTPPTKSASPDDRNR